MAVATTALITAGITAGATAYAAHKASSANKDAAKSQADASTKAAEIDAQGNKDALDWTKQVYNRDQEALNPYTQIGGSAMTTLGQALGLPAPKPYQPITTPIDPNHIAPGPGAPGSASLFTGGQTIMVPLIGKDGTPKSVPASEASYWMARGATLAAGAKIPQGVKAPPGPMVPGAPNAQVGTAMPRVGGVQ